MADEGAHRAWALDSILENRCQGLAQTLREVPKGVLPLLVEFQRHPLRSVISEFWLPANRTGVDGRRKEIRTERKPLIFSEVEDSVYGKMGYDKLTHLLLVWHSKWNSVAGRHAARNLAGSSGGGIWSFDLSSADVPPKLAATFTEIPHRHGRKVIVGTRIHVHRDLGQLVIRDSAAR